MTLWWLSDNSVMTLWWLCDDFLMTLMTLRWPSEDSFQKTFFPIRGADYAHPITCPSRFLDDATWPIWPNFEVNGLDWQCCLANSSKTAPRIFNCPGCQKFVLCEINWDPCKSHFEKLALKWCIFRHEFLFPTNIIS